MNKLKKNSNYNMELDLYLNDLQNRIENDKKMEAKEIPYEKNQLSEMSVSDI